MTRAVIGIGVLVALVACTSGPQAPLSTSGPVPPGTDAVASASDAVATPTGSAPAAHPQATVAPGWSGTFRGPDGTFVLTQDGNTIRGTHARAGETGQMETVEVLGQVGTNPDGTQFVSLNYLSGAVKLVTLIKSGTAIRVDGQEYTKS